MNDPLDKDMLHPEYDQGYKDGFDEGVSAANGLTHALLIGIFITVSVIALYHIFQ